MNDKFVFFNYQVFHNILNEASIDRILDEPVYFAMKQRIDFGPTKHRTRTNICQMS